MQPEEMICPGCGKRYSHGGSETGAMIMRSFAQTHANECEALHAVEDAEDIMNGADNA